MFTEVQIIALSAFAFDKYTIKVHNVISFIVTKIALMEEVKTKRIFWEKRRATFISYKNSKLSDRRNARVTKLQLDRWS